MTADTIAKSDALEARQLRGATLCQILHWLASGRVDATRLCEAHLAAIEEENPRLNAYVHVAAAEAREQARAAAARRATGVFGRLDGVPVSVKDNIEVAGLPTRGGLAAPGVVAARDAHAVERLRRAGAVILGKTHVPEGVSASSANPHTGDAHNPWRHGFQAGGSSGGAAAAVAAGLCSVAIGSDSLGSIRIPASYCGVFGLKPTSGEISTRGMLPASRRLDSIGMIARSVDDLSILLHVLGGYDADDPRSRRRRVELELPDWEPGKLRAGAFADLAAFGTEPAVAAAFQTALQTLGPELGALHQVDLGDFPLQRARRAALFLIEAEMLVTHAAALAAAPVSPRLAAMLDWARGKSAADYCAADRLIDTATLAARRLFERVDVLVTPTTPQPAFALDVAPPDTQGDFTCFANFAGCPALTMPMGMTADGLPLGLQFLGPPGSDLRLLELAEVCAAALDATPQYPVVPGAAV